jgi:tetratricopeptide (TPR) repeat protein
MKTKFTLISIILILSLGQIVYGQSKWQKAQELVIESEKDISLNEKIELLEQAVKLDASYDNTWRLSEAHKQRAMQFENQGIALLAANELVKAIELLSEAHKLYPDDIAITFVLSRAYLYNRQYENSLKLSKSMLYHRAGHQIYQMIIEGYMGMDNRSQAEKYFKEGLKKHPQSGRLYYARGRMDQGGDYETALKYFEKGIQVEPDFPMNYFGAYNTSNIPWRMIYGEIFMNLERGSRLNHNISGDIYYTYEYAFLLEDTLPVVDFYCEDYSHDSQAKSFCFFIQELFASSAKNEKEVHTASIFRIRRAFIENYFKGGYNRKYPNVLFDYQKKILDAGHFEAYSRWVILTGDDTLDEWIEANPTEWNAFNKWFDANPLKFDQNNFVFRNNANDLSGY